MITDYQIPIKTELRPAHYDSFHCLMQRCRDNCCNASWRIEFDKADYLRLRDLNVPVAYKSRLEGAVRRLRGAEIHDGMYGKIQMRDGACPLLSEGGLCSLQRTCGAAVLPAVCQNFPRTTRYSPGFQERGLTLACEGVLEMLWNLTDGITFVEEVLPEVEQRIFYAHDTEGMERVFPEVRSLCIDILQARQLPLSARLLFLGLSLQKLKEESWSLKDAPRWLARTEALLADPNLAETMGGIPGDHTRFLLQNTRIAAKLHASSSALSETLLRAVGYTADTVSNTNLISERLYEQAECRFRATFPNFPLFMENIMVSLAMQHAFPDLHDRESLWKSYVNLCNLYSFYRFAAVAGCAEIPTKEQLFHILVEVGRALLHNQVREHALRDEFFANSSATLAHMAILVGGPV